MKNIDKEELSTYISITRITISICWITLIIFWIIKLLGGNWFEVAVQNENFVKFSKLVETTWLKYLVSFVTVCFGNYLLFGAIYGTFRFGKIQSIILFAMFVSMWTVVSFVPIEWIKMFYGYACIILYTVITQKGKKKLLGVLAIALQFAFTTLSMLTRNVDIYVQQNYILSLILSIDSYIMYGLYYLYYNLIRIKKEN